jgi:hypothetical protein
MRIRKLDYSEVRVGTWQLCVTSETIASEVAQRLEVRVNTSSDAVRK